MTPEERELRRALDARSGSLSPDFRNRLSAALAEDKPTSNLMLALALIAAIVLVFASVGVLLLTRHARSLPPVGATSGPRLTTPSPTPLSTPGVVVTPTPIAMPTDATLSASQGDVVWALVAEQYLARSTNGGITWTQRPLPPSIGGFPRTEISFVNDHEGWLTTGGSPETQCNAETIAIWHTTDAGAIWQMLTYKGVSQSQCKEHPSFVDSSRGFLDAFDQNHAPVIYRTSDGGQTWAASHALPDPPGFKTVGAGITLQAGTVRAFGSTMLVTAVSPSHVQYVFRSIDGGATWAYAATSPNLDGTVALVTASHWVQLTGPGLSIETTNAGASWHTSRSDYSQAAPVPADFVFGDSQVGYATVRGGISRTVDGGLHWRSLHTPGT